MMLILQIAAGIVLGYLVILYHVVLLRWLKSMLSVLLTLVVVGAIVWVIVGLADTAHDWITASPQGQRVWSKLGSFGLAMIFLAGWAWGLFGLLLLSDEMLPSERVGKRLAGMKQSYAVIAAILYLATGVFWELPIFRETVIGDIYWGADDWSRSNGWADTGQMMILTLTYQWSWIVYVLVRKMRGKPLWDEESPPSRQLDHEAEDG
jgi:hypothetical protein